MNTTSPPRCQPDIRRLAELSQTLTRRIRGQDEILDRLVEEIVRRELNTVPQTGCRGALFFAGPTGVGKTETARLLAATLFGSEAFVRFDCSEFKTLGSIAGLLGDRAGDPGRFGQAYASVPAGVWLFDEIEKAHAEFVHLFLQMTDAGRLTLASGETLDLSRIYIVVTSNLGSAEILGREHLPFASLEKHVVRCIRRHLRPELLARFGKPYVFRPLTREVQAEIADEQLTGLMRWQREQGRCITFDESIVRFVLQRGFSPELGARPLLATIRELVGNAVGESLLSGGSGEGRLVIEGTQLRLVR
jgi:ATP-dependent Clp protease ATP-binding subunit ClpA